MSISINKYIGTNAQKYSILVLIYSYIMRIEIILVPIYNNLTRSSKTDLNKQPGKPKAPIPKAIYL